MPIPLLREYITNLLEKGIPIQKIYKNTRPYIFLDPKFKNLQAKQNILKKRKLETYGPSVSVKYLKFLPEEYFYEIVICF